MSPSTTIRAEQQDARAWATFTGCNYTAALRQIRHPLAQGFLGERISARTLIETLREHDVVGQLDEQDPVLGENGFYDENGFRFNGDNDYVELALIADVLRMFTPTTSPAEDDVVGSYSFKHTAEKFLAEAVGDEYSYVTNGRAIWVAAALGLELREADGGGPNLLIGISEREHDYVKRVSSEIERTPKAHHFRPSGFEHLRTALTAAAAGHEIEDAFADVVVSDERAPFHDWLTLQVDREDPIGDLARDYVIGIRASEHGKANTASEMIALFHSLPHDPGAYDAVVEAITEWMRDHPDAELIRTSRDNAARYEHDGWGAGAGATERYTYRCPCGDGRIIEEHEDTPGFRDHDAWIECDRCRGDWKVDLSRGARDWSLIPTAASVGV